jgi:hypothetical protein
LRVSKDIIEGSGADFEDKLSIFAHELKLHMLNLNAKSGMQT